MEPGETPKTVSEYDEHAPFHSLFYESNSFNSFGANFTKWSNTLKFADELFECV